MIGVKDEFSNREVYWQKKKESEINNIMHCIANHTVTLLLKIGRSESPDDEVKQAHVTSTWTWSLPRTYGRKQGGLNSRRRRVAVGDEKGAGKRLWTRYSKRESLPGKELHADQIFLNVLP